MQRLVRLFNFTEYFNATKSSHPHLLGLPVVAPYSLPISAIFFPSWQKSSVGNGPSPTLVVYAYATPSTSEKMLLGNPEPIPTEVANVFEDVTYGYVP